MEELKLYPTLRFFEFKEKWKKEKIGEITNVVAGGTPSTFKKEYWGGDIRWMNSGELNLKRVYEVENRITDEGLKKSSTKLIPAYCILIGLAGQGKTRGTVAMNIVELCINQSIAAIYPQRKKYVPDFLYHNLDNRYDELRKLSTGEGGRGGLNLQIIKSLPVFLPSLSEQAKIASFLSIVDKRIELLIQKRDELEQYKKGIMQKIFDREIRLKDDDGNDFTEWKEKKISEIGETYNGLTGKSKEDFGSGKPYIQYMQIFSNSKIDTRQFGLVDVDENDNQNKVQKGDVFFTTSSETPNEIGTASVLLEDVEEVYLNSFCFGFRPNSILELIPEFAQFLFRSGQVRRKIVRLAQGSTRYNMSKVEFMKQTIMLPTPEEQEKIASFLSAIDNKIEKANSQIDFMKNWKKGLLQQMFI